MKNKVYVFFKSAKADAFNDSMVVDVDGVKQGVIKAGEELTLELDNGNHTLEIYMYDKKKCYAKKELNVNKSETYLTYSAPTVYTMKGNIVEVNKEKYSKKRKNDKLYAILLVVVAVLIYIILSLLG